MVSCALTFVRFVVQWDYTRSQVQSTKISRVRGYDGWCAWELVGGDGEESRHNMTTDIAPT